MVVEDSDHALLDMHLSPGDQAPRRVGRVVNHAGVISLSIIAEIVDV